MTIPPEITRVKLFSQLDEEEIKRFTTRFKSENFDPGQYVFKENDPGDALYIVQKGLVSLNKAIIGDVQKKLMSARPGLVFGEFSFLDGGNRSASAKVEDESTLLSLTRRDFDNFVQKNRNAGLKVYENILSIVVERLRRTNDSYRDAVRWGLEITGTQTLNFQYLISENIAVRIELINAKIYEGKVIQLEKSDAGHEVALVNKLGQPVIIPYHAIASITQVH